MSISIAGAVIFIAVMVAMGGGIALYSRKQDRVIRAIDDCLTMCEYGADGMTDDTYGDPSADQWTISSDLREYVTGDGEIIVKPAGGKYAAIIQNRKNDAEHRRD